MTGDLINSDRFADELLNSATSRAKASVLATTLISQFIVDLNRVTDVSILSVCGNESRINKDWGWSDHMISDNYDHTIFNMLKLMFHNSDGIEFIEGNDLLETVVNVNGKNIMFTHGYQKKYTQSKVQEIIGKYSLEGIKIDYIVFGHIHFAEVTDTYARSSSLSGGNIYSSRALELASRASQNCFIVYSRGYIDAIKIDLQDISEEDKGYYIDNTLTDCWVKSHEDLKVIKQNFIRSI